jgi:hypothetical protein
VGECGSIWHKNVEDFPFPTNNKQEKRVKKRKYQEKNKTIQETKYASQRFTHRTAS